MRSLVKLIVLAVLLGTFGSVGHAQVQTYFNVWANPTSIPANGTSTSILTAQIYQSGFDVDLGTYVYRPIVGAPVTFSVSGPASLSGTNPAITGSNGQANINLVSTTSPGDAVVTATTDAYGSNNVTVKTTTITPPPPPPPTQNLPPVITSVSADPTSGKSPLTVQFNLTATDPDGYIASYYWSFGDGKSSKLQNPVHTYTVNFSSSATSKTFNVYAAVYDNLKAKASKSLKITVTR